MGIESTSEIRSEEERALSDQYANRHERLDNFIFIYAVPSRLCSKLGIELHTSRGYALLWSFFFVVILLPGLVITALSPLPSEIPPLRLTLVAAILAALNVLTLIVAQAAAYKISALHRTLRDASKIRALLQWDRRWYTPSTSALMGGVIALLMLLTLYELNHRITGVNLSPTTVWLCAVITIFLGQFSFSTAMVFFEFRNFIRCRFELYLLSPIDTYALQTTSTGLKQLGFVSIIFLPLFLLVLLSVLPESSNLNVPITGAFLSLAYLAAAIGTLAPLGSLGSIVKAEKWRLLNPLQDRLNRMVRELETLPCENHEEYTRLQTLHNTIRDSKDTLLNTGAVLRVSGGVLLSTITVISTSVIQSYLQRLL